MNESNKHLKKLLKAYINKLNDVGGKFKKFSLKSVNYIKVFVSAPVPEIEPEVTAPPVQFDSLLPVVRKKPSDFFGMFEYKKEHESQILRALIYGTKLYFFRGLKHSVSLCLNLNIFLFLQI